MMFTLQLEEYVRRSGDLAMAAALKEKVYDIYAWLDRYTNALGLLEDLPGWIFLDWGYCNCAEGLHSNLVYLPEAFAL